MFELSEDVGDVVRHQNSINHSGSRGDEPIRGLPSLTNISTAILIGLEQNTVKREIVGWHDVCDWHSSAKNSISLELEAIHILILVENGCIG